ncbi:DegT/DnrJ/EryC1/StrS aminotransferase [Magnetococcus marinus MC-1]|uniref:DegT/DnrJ/EryC1/StrS aminotransferase n=1 Tax=Magnetococcus marinus (strain ATCC BAA-1437 / JCM 17883 / MC-1) TaxID=156889 RepID=A0LAC9_MAGMM|nr:DegT/DnrJ/EryC1/StrS family aminotransferase [Magnetococcus marinus]ABK44922.1 DegT/DnrJ/EryC1/StrS aminotransferase [Magnetococcus marinus MC-1]
MQFVDLLAQHRSIQVSLDAAIAHVVEHSSFIRGPHVEAFEQGFAQMMGAKHCISCGNGTDALYIAMRALGLEAGDEVITTAHSWIATSETITQAGGQVVFCDTEPNCFCLDPLQIESKITPRTRGIIAVHLYGQPADMSAIMALAKAYDLWVIEDAAQAHLAAMDGQLVGRFGDVATFSFYPGKNLGAMGDAGCLVTDRQDVADFARLFARHGGKNNHQIEGINSRMDGLQAAVLNVKMPHLEGWTRAREALAQRYDSMLAELPQVITPTVRSGCRHVYHLYVIRVPQRDALQAYLAELYIPTVINYPQALPFYPAYARLGHKPVDFPVAFQHAQEILSLPMHPFLSQQDQERVVEGIRAFYAQPVSIAFEEGS